MWSVRRLVENDRSPDPGRSAPPKTLRGQTASTATTGIGGSAMDFVQRWAPHFRRHLATRSE